MNDTEHDELTSGEKLGGASTLRSLVDQELREIFAHQPQNEAQRRLMELRLHHLELAGKLARALFDEALEEHR